MAGIGDYDYDEFQSSARPPLYDDHDDGDGAIPRLAVIAAVIAIVLGAAVGYYVFKSRRPAATEAAAPKAATVTAPAVAANQIEHIDLPALDDSDALVRQRIGILSSNRLVTTWLGTNGLIRNFVVVVENISHGVNPSKHLAVLRPRGEFRVRTRGSQVVIDPRSYDRFTAISDAAASIDARMAGRLYQSFTPLLQMAYDELGNQEPVDRAVERVIVGLLEVPAIDTDVRVEQTHAGIGYQYADDKLESLNGAQKQLLRMGARNVRVIQRQLQIFGETIGIPAQRPS